MAGMNRAGASSVEVFKKDSRAALWWLRQQEWRESDQKYRYEVTLPPELVDFTKTLIEELRERKIITSPMPLNDNVLRVHQADLDLLGITKFAASKKPEVILPPDVPAPTHEWAIGQQIQTLAKGKPFVITASGLSAECTLGNDKDSKEAAAAIVALLKNEGASEAHANKDKANNHVVHVGFIGVGKLREMYKGFESGMLQDTPGTRVDLVTGKLPTTPVRFDPVVYLDKSLMGNYKKMGKNLAALESALVEIQEKWAPFESEPGGKTQALVTKEKSQTAFERAANKFKKAARDCGIDDVRIQDWSLHVGAAGTETLTKIGLLENWASKPDYKPQYQHLATGKAAAR